MFEVAGVQKRDIERPIIGSALFTRLALREESPMC